MPKKKSPKTKKAAVAKTATASIKSRIIMLGLFIIAALWGYHAYLRSHIDTWCTFPHKTSATPPPSRQTAADWLAQGDYDYDIGKCKEAIDAYTQAITLNPQFAEAYNNRAYTHMRLRQYDQALPDLDKALKFRPNYPNALMNRGDIRNFYFQKDRSLAIADYDKARELGTPDNEVCGHRLMAARGGWSLAVIWQLITKGPSAACR